MAKIEQFGKTVYSVSDSAVDGNRLYSILLDARASQVSESMYDIADTLLKSEKENAKVALDKLWALKKNLQPEHDTGTVDLLIRFYQEKMDVLRSREEHIKKVAQDSRGLLEEKRRRDGEIARVKQEIADCTTEIDRLNIKLDQLRIKEQELTLIGSQLKKELQINSNEIVNGLYEIILSQERMGASVTPLQDEPAEPAMSVAAGSISAPIAVPPVETAPVEVEAAAMAFGLAGVPPAMDRVAAVIDTGESGQAVHEDTAVVPVESAPAAASPDGEGTTEISPEGTRNPAGQIFEPPAPVSFPKSVVKTTKGRVIGEYYYDASVYKNKRHYIFNSAFFGQQLFNAMQSMERKFDAQVFNESYQMVQDAHKRLSEADRLHVEVSVNEILNLKNLKELLQLLKSRKFDEAGRFAKRLNAKIETLGRNYPEMLSEQMARYLEE